MAGAQANPTADWEPKAFKARALSLSPQLSPADVEDATGIHHTGCRRKLPSSEVPVRHKLPLWT